MERVAKAAVVGCRGGAFLYTLMKIDAYVTVFWSVLEILYFFFIFLFRRFLRKLCKIIIFSSSVCLYF